ncbi:hypothetical protein [Bifidobacterium cuniculi]|uniref:Uncharacterized protein n=1 Tax=Bifidobacterium cuniculi TaxID=1688 RepID=A0A087AFH1_9BIFI|nr:hypothetical protein [Bifidobacterium cuniculi]KFI57521.1 hypothetical protein BCUN_1869 [Bifidobacterium cuniculi]
MAGFNPEQEDWLEHMRLYAGNTREVFDNRLDDKWIKGHCLTACDIAFQECPSAEVFLESGKLPKRVFCYVVCCMVLRVARWTRVKTESNGAFQRTDQTMETNQPGWEISPDLMVTSKERSLLNCEPKGRSAFGSVSMGLNRVYGM